MITIFLNVWLICITTHITLFVFFQPATYEKMEKADILQMTVEYMKRLASLPDTSNQNWWYSSGYDECRRAAHSYLLSSRLGHDAKTRLVCDAHSNVALRRPAIDVCRSRQRCDIRDVTPDNIVDLDDKDAATSSEIACDVFNTEAVVCGRKPFKIHVCSSIGNVWRPW